jgi:hypothetical protein
VQVGILLVVAALVVYSFRASGCLPGVDGRKATEYADCLRERQQVGRAALAVGAALVVIGATRLIRQRR